MGAYYDRSDVFERLVDVMLDVEDIRFSLKLRGISYCDKHGKDSVLGLVRAVDELSWLFGIEGVDLDPRRRLDLNRVLRVRTAVFHVMTAFCGTIEMRGAEVARTRAEGRQEDLAYLWVKGMLPDDEAAANEKVYKSSRPLFDGVSRQVRLLVDSEPIGVEDDKGASRKQEKGAPYDGWKWIADDAP